MPIEPIEDAPGARISIERGLQIRGNLGLTLRRIRGVEAPVATSLLDLLEARRTHPAELDQQERALAIHLRPFAVGTPRRKSYQPVVGVEPVDLPVDPSVAKRCVDCFLPRDTRDSRR
jgi:hypothetical protein